MAGDEEWEEREDERDSEEIYAELDDYNDTEEDIYSDSYREDLVENGEISSREDGFMTGYDESG